MSKKLNNPPLIYVLIQVNISPIVSIAKFIPNLQETIRKDFPDIQEINVQVFNLLSGHAKTIEEKKRWHFRDKAKTTGIFIDLNNIFIHTSNYSTFDQIMEKYNKALSQFNNILDISLWNKLGIRYINLISNPKDEIQDKLQGFSLPFKGLIEEQFITKTETLQKTQLGMIRIKASTFNDQENISIIERYIPPDLLDTANMLDFVQFTDKVSETFNKKFTILDIDHFTIDSPSENFNCNEIITKLYSMHDVMDTAFKQAVTQQALEKWG